MRYRKLADMTDAELAEIAKQKNRRGCATGKALRAQHELYERHHWDEVKYRGEETDFDKKKED